MECVSSSDGFSASVLSNHIALSALSPACICGWEDFLRSAHCWKQIALAFRDGTALGGRSNWIFNNLSPLPRSATASTLPAGCCRQRVSGWWVCVCVRPSSQRAALCSNTEARKRLFTGPLPQAPSPLCKAGTQAGPGRQLADSSHSSQGVQAGFRVGRGPRAPLCRPDTDRPAAPAIGQAAGAGQSCCPGLKPLTDADFSLGRCLRRWASRFPRSRPVFEKTLSKPHLARVGEGKATSALVFPPNNFLQSYEVLKEQQIQHRNHLPSHVTALLLFSAKFMRQQRTSRLPCAKLSAEPYA